MINLVQEPRDEKRQSKLPAVLYQLVQEVERVTKDRRSRILIIEGDRDVRTMLELTFSYNGASYQVSTAPSGRSALLQFGIVRPDVVLIDLDMPDKDGWETLARIRELSSVPVIAVSGVESAEVEVRSLVAGADYCLIKPFGLRELHARVRALMRRDGSAAVGGAAAGGTPAWGTA